MNLEFSKIDAHHLHPTPARPNSTIATTVTILVIYGHVKKLVLVV